MSTKPKEEALNLLIEHIVEFQEILKETKPVINNKNMKKQLGYAKTRIDKIIERLNDFKKVLEL